MEVSLDGSGLACWVYAPEAELLKRGVPIESGDWMEHAKAKKGPHEGARPGKD